MQTIIEQRAAERITYIVDTMQAAQGDVKSTKKHLKEIQKASGFNPPQKVTTAREFEREFGSGF